jgi:hypothetical protein
MFKSSPNKITIDWIKCSVKIYEVCMKAKVEFYTIVYDTRQWIKLIYTWPIPPKTTLILSE